MFCSDFVPSEPINIAQFTSDVDEELDAMDQYEFMQQLKQQQQEGEQPEDVEGEEQSKYEQEQEDHQDEDEEVNLEDGRNPDSLLHLTKSKSKLP